jgi:magnesium chelatase subunit D
MTTASDAALAAALFAVDPAGLGGVSLHSPVHPVRDQWLELLKSFLPADSPLRRMPCNVADDRLLGDLDLAATLRSNRPVAERGILAAADGGVLVVAMAERLTAVTASRLASALDLGEVAVPRSGVLVSHPARIGIVLLDEAMADDERVPAALLDRTALLLDFDDLPPRSLLTPLHDRADIDAARSLLPQVSGDTPLLTALCATALALGVDSPRIYSLAWRAARAAAALDGRTQVSKDDAVLAGRLVLAPRATLAPPQEPEADPQPPQIDEPPPDDHAQADDEAQANDEPPPDRESQSPPQAAQEPPQGTPPEPQPGEERDLDLGVLAATQAAIPPGLLARLRSENASRMRASGSGRVGALRKTGTRGRPSGTGNFTGRRRLHVVETLRAAAPWQRLRGRRAEEGSDGRIRVARSDLREQRYKERSATLTIFAVDASGSAALNRLAEAKGAVELILADCYIRRDQVAVIAFRGRSAEILLPPTRSLVRAKRSLASLPGGGGTPLAAAIDAAAVLAMQAKRRGETATLVLLTDGRANITRGGGPGRDIAHAEALSAARAVGLAGIAALFIDTSPKPNPLSRDLAAAMQAQYVPLPYASAERVSGIVRAAAALAGD